MCTSRRGQGPRWARHGNHLSLQQKKLLAAGKEGDDQDDELRPTSTSTTRLVVDVPHAVRSESGVLDAVNRTDRLMRNLLGFFFSKRPS